MLLERENLEAMTVKQLLAFSYDIQCVIDNPLMGKEAIIDQLMLSSAMEPVVDTKTPADDTTAAKKHVAMSCTIEQIRDELNPFILRGLKLYHNANDNTWLIRMKLKNSRIIDKQTGEEKFIEKWKEDSGTLRQPLATIRRCASILMQNTPSARELAVEPVSSTKDYEAVA